MSEASSARAREQDAPGEPATGRFAPWLLLAPGLIIFVPFYLAPMIYALANTFWRQEDLGVFTGPGFANYTAIFSDWFYLRALLGSIRVSLIVCLLSLIIGYPLAYELAHARGRYRAVLTLIVLAPLLVGLVVRAYGWLVILGPNGLINTALMNAGLIERPLTLLWTEAAICIGLTHVYAPFMVLGILGTLQSIDWRLVLAARGLGANRWQAWYRIVLPLSLPGVAAGTIIVFALSISAFVTPVMLGGKSARLLAVYAWQTNTVILDYPMGAALAVVLVLVGTIAMFLYALLLRRVWGGSS